MTWALEQTEEINEDTINENLATTDHKDVINGQLYTLFATKTTEDPKLIVQNTAAGMGFETWRKINKRYDLKAKCMSDAGMKAIMKYSNERDIKHLNHRAEKLEEMMRR